MYRYLIFQRYYSDYFIVKFFDLAPKPKSIPLLLFDFHWILDNIITPFFFKIRSFAKHFVEKVIGEFIFLCHRCAFIDSLQPAT